MTSNMLGGTIETEIRITTGLEATIQLTLVIAESKETASNRARNAIATLFYLFQCLISVM